MAFVLGFGGGSGSPVGWGSPPVTTDGVGAAD